MRELARGTGLRPATIVDLELNRKQRIEQSHLARIVTYFRERGIPCDISDLLVYDPPAEEPESSEVGGPPA